MMVKLNIFIENLKSVRGPHWVLSGLYVARGPNVAQARSKGWLLYTDFIERLTSIFSICLCLSIFFALSGNSKLEM